MKSVPAEPRLIIGIVGGVGPHAGYDLALKILQETDASADQQHIPVVTVSDSDMIGDRTEFLLGRSDVNPGLAISQVLQKLERAGATAAGIPCNTAHAPRILSLVREDLRIRTSPLTLLHMVEEVGRHIRERIPTVTRVALLSTLGTATSGVYQDTLAGFGLGVVLPNPRTQELVHDAIYNQDYGIKAHSQPVMKKARAILDEVLKELKAEGLSTVILGCTELPIALSEPSRNGMRLIDATRVLARALIRETYPEKLKHD